MLCNRNNCKGPMYEKGYGRDKYYSCIICGHLIWVNPVIQKSFEEVQEQCKMRIAAAEKCIKRLAPVTFFSHTVGSAEDQPSIE